MTTPVGGLRTRFIHDSLRLRVQDILTRLHWFVAVDGRLPVTLSEKPASWDEPIDLNTVAVAMGRLPADEPSEVGTLQAIHRWTAYVDFFAENDSIGLHLIEDVRDGLAGKNSASGRATPFFDVYNFLEATPSILFTCEITSLEADTPPPVSGNPWTNHVHVLVIEFEDVYGSDTDDE